MPWIEFHFIRLLYTLILFISPYYLSFVFKYKWLLHFTRSGGGGQTVGRVCMNTDMNYRSPMGAGLAVRGERRADCPRGWCPNPAPTFRLLSFLPGGLRDWFRAHLGREAPGENIGKKASSSVSSSRPWKSSSLSLTGSYPRLLGAYGLDISLRAIVPFSTRIKC